MMLVSMKTCPALLWGLCVLFIAEAVTFSTIDDTSVQQTTVINREKATQAVTTTVTPAVTQGPTQSATEEATTAAGSRMSHAKETEKNPAANVTTQNSGGGTVGLGVMSTESVPLHHNSTEATATDGATQSPQLTTIVKGAEQSSTSPTTTPASATSAAETFHSTVAELGNASESSSSTNSSHSGLPVSTQSSPLTSNATTETNTSEAAPLPGTASPPAIITETHVSTERSSASPSEAGVPVATSRPPGPSSAATSSESTASTSAGILIPVEPKKKPQPPTKPAAVTTAAVSKSTPAPEVQPCSTRSVVNRCLIVIACLAVLATIFIMSTIILCAKLSGRRYRMKRDQEATEMMCISSLLPERHCAYTRQRNPITNGVLVIPRGGDSDDDGGDNVTLSSFFPENDRYV